MKRWILILGAVVLNYSGTNIYAQKADVGLSWNTANKAKWSFEWRYALSDKNRLRIGVVAGNDPYWLTNRYLSATDSTIKIREYSELARNFELRTGLERSLAWKHFFVGADLVWSYSNRVNQATTNDYRRRDYYGADNNGWPVPIGVGVDQSGSTRHFLGIGLSASLAWEYPIYERLLISAKVSASLVGRYQIAHLQYDLFDEYGDYSEMGITTYAGFGVGVKYKF
jgi:hypothetical protein